LYAAIPVALMFSIAPFAWSRKAKNVRRFGARQGRARGGEGRARSARAYREEPVADDAFSSNGDHRISAYRVTKDQSDTGNM